jgi:DUF917 family protein
MGVVWVAEQQEKLAIHVLLVSKRDFFMQLCLSLKLLRCGGDGEVIASDAFQQSTCKKTAAVAIQDLENLAPTQMILSKCLAQK